MRFAIIAAVLALGASALPEAWWGNHGNGNGKPGPCLNDTGADYLVQGYTYLLEYPQGADFNATANAILSDKFFVSSDSINSLSQRPLGVDAYPSKQAFIAGQAQTPALPGLVTLETFHTCDRIAWRWNVTEFGTRQYEVKGIITFNVDPAALLIDAVFSEFNTVAFAADIPSQ